MLYNFHSHYLPSLGALRIKLSEQIFLLHNLWQVLPSARRSHHLRQIASTWHAVIVMEVQLVVHCAGPQI